MGMSIDEAVMHIMDVICENNTIKHSDLVVFDNEKQALRIAVDTMRKYQKIKQLLHKWSDIELGANAENFMGLIQEIVEDADSN